MDPNEVLKLFKLLLMVIGANQQNEKAASLIKVGQQSENRISEKFLWKAANRD